MIDVNSPTWKEIEEFVSMEIVSQLEQLEQQSNIETTQYTRGYIRALRRLRALPQQDTSSPISDAGSPNYN